MSHKMADPSPERTLRSAFAVFDGDGDGTISNQEMKRVMRCRLVSCMGVLSCAVWTHGLEQHVAKYTMSSISTLMAGIWASQ
mmetsp:Transcript_65898/g.130679  ORF Transcript_65898/g.130679 Transcript_65898/m.130679 type:complete len:82 (-) Transcript_65898:324-569(-)